MRGGRSFSRTKSSPTKSMSSTKAGAAGKSSFSRGLMGGLLGGALGGMLFGSMFGGGGSGGGGGMGILPILILAGGAYFLFRKFKQQSKGGKESAYTRPTATPSFGGGMNGGENTDVRPPPAPAFAGMSDLDEGIDQIKATDQDFEKEHFIQVASDVFFQIQAGWMRRDISSYRHLVGNQLAEEYTSQFAKMKAAGRTNKLESIAVRSIEVIAAGSDGLEDFVTVRFIASLLDYTVDDKTGDIVEGSNTAPVKFEEEWTWARSVKTNNWKLEGIN
ncbi:hypothetical membrane protein [Desulfotalea psychrophila LSv54]|uniref:Hypothetical membrane protein n=2 Tax=Desulfotalea psychrophila TaxID=84980 RepID=Q6AII9_DESPS|nr:hypothetical membrane protein [Desulfotalea psychrophila LSv54]